MKNFKIALFLFLLIGLSNCSKKPTIIIDQKLQPSVPELSGLSGGPPRQVVAAKHSGEKQVNFVVDEVNLVPASEDDLNDFLNKYNATVLRAGVPNERSYLIKVDLSTSSSEDLVRNLSKAGLDGEFRFSGSDAVKLTALIAREVQSIKIEPNIYLEPDQSQENSDGQGGNVDWEGLPWMTEDNDLSQSGDQGLSIGVAKAWDYLAYKGLPNNTSSASIAIIDVGFWLDPSDGFPIGGNTDWTRIPAIRPLQVDVIDEDYTAGNASSTTFHGTNVAAVAGATRNNLYGGAGSSGNYASTILFRHDLTHATLAEAIFEAVDVFHVDVINISSGGECSFFCDVSQFFGLGESFCLQLAINNADNNGTIVVGSAGNKGIDLGTIERVPTELEPLVTVGGINFSGKNSYNFGSSIDIWAPTPIRSTVTPNSQSNTGINQVVSFMGTSASAPFVSGIVSMMKALNANLKTNAVISILQNTANFSTADVTNGTLVTKGWVDALRAVQAASPNEPPEVIIVYPPEGESFYRGQNITILARVSDPELSDRGLSYERDVNFEKSGVPIGTGLGPLTSISLATPDPGAQQVMVKTTDAFGAEGSATVNYQVVDRPPIARIDFPKAPDNSFCQDQEVCFNGTGYDLDIYTPGNVSLEWKIDGGAVLSTERHFCTVLPFGTHNITLTVTDVFGESATDNELVIITPPCGKPSTKIVIPASFASFGTSDITMQGEGTDPEDGVLLSNSLRWYSNIDGFLGTGNTITVSLTTIQDLGGFDGELSHIISLVATDSDGNDGGTDKIVVRAGLVL